MEYYDNFIIHMSRVLKTDTSIPIIVCPRGHVLDGYHRIAMRLLIDNKTTIQAYRLKKMPKHDMDMIKGEWVDVKR